MKTKNPRNQAVLITYADSMGKNIPELHRLLLRHFKEAVGGVHLLPFYPSSADRGFAPLCYDKVDSSFGTYGDVRELAKELNTRFAGKGGGKPEMVQGSLNGTEAGIRSAIGDFL